MYIEFYLPPEKGGLLPHQVRNHISGELRRWATKHNIPYKEKTVKLVHRITFDDDRYYALFNMTWNPTRLSWIPGQQAWWYDYRIIKDLNNKI